MTYIMSAAEEIKKGIRTLCNEIKTENFPSLGRGKKPRSRSSKVPKQTQLKKRSSPRNHVTHKEIPIRLQADVSGETLMARREQGMFQVLKEKTYQPRTLYPAKLPCRNGREKLSQTKFEGIYHH